MTPQAKRCPNHGNRRATMRGVCTTCYNAVAQRVSRGELSWAEAEAQGLVLPQQPRGRPRKTFKTVK